MKARTLWTLAIIVVTGCAGGRKAISTGPLLQPATIPHSAWEAHPPLGYDADATRRNLAPGDTLEFGQLTVAVISAREATSDADRDSLDLDLARGDRRAAVTMAEGTARTWDGYRIAVLALHLAEDELGRGLAELEIADASTVPEHIRVSAEAGGPASRLRVKHTPTHVTLHHSGSAEPLTADEDPVEKLSNLQTWGESDRGWWDVPYHFLIDLDGNIYEGRSWRYMGETNTRYNPSGHLLISVLGNYSLQEPTEAQVNAIADLMAWSVDQFDIPIDRIQGHSDLAPTECPGDHLRKRLRDGTFQEMVAVRLGRTSD
ncbi:MAG: N-acetylmuramoyl-L-alanine amidase [Rhodothermales bacterium]|nr:N-acetylmuramoyl-L-alanine amidase [Rhodothermales bacterium]